MKSGSRGVLSCAAEHRPPATKAEWLDPHAAVSMPFSASSLGANRTSFRTSRESQSWENILQKLVQMASFQDTRMIRPSAMNHHSYILQSLWYVMMANMWQYRAIPWRILKATPENDTTLDSPDPSLRPAQVMLPDESPSCKESCLGP